MKRILFTSLIVTATVCYFSCKRKDITAMQQTITKAEAWLKHKGGNYKSGTMMVKLPDSSEVQGRLDWTKATSYTVKNQPYLKIPFIFDRVGENVPTDKLKERTRFYIVMREVNNTFEAALQVTLLNGSFTNEETKTVQSAALQMYYTLTGEPINAYIRRATDTLPQSVSLAPAEPGMTRFRAFSLPVHPSGGSSGKIMLAPARPATSTTCITYSYTYYTYTLVFINTGEGGMSVPVTIATPQTGTARVCADSGGGGDSGGISSSNGVSAGKGGSSGGGGTSGGVIYPPDIPSDDNKQPQSNDPCANAKAAAAKIAAALNDPKIKAQMEKFIVDYKNSTVEHGFAIIKNADGTYGFTQTFPGDDHHVEWTFTGNPDIVALIHVHPPDKSAIPSPTDIFGLNNYRNADFAGSIVISGDDRYMVSITDADKYNKFVAKKNDYYDINTQSQWKYKSKIDNEFSSFSRNYMQMYHGQDAVFPTQLYLMKDFNMGVSLQKWNADSFAPIATNAQYNMNAGASATVGGGGQIISSEYSSITVDAACN